MDKAKLKNIAFYFLGGAAFAVMLYLSSQSCAVKWLQSKISGLTLVHNGASCNLVP